MENDDQPVRFAPPDPPDRAVWGHPVRQLELIAWYWAEMVLERRPLWGEAVADLIARLEQTVEGLAEPEAAAIGWRRVPDPSGDVAHRLEELARVMAELATLFHSSQIDV